MKMSPKLRSSLESILEHMVIDRPYASPDAERGMISVLGYAVDAEGEKVSSEEWFSRIPRESGGEL